MILIIQNGYVTPRIHEYLTKEYVIVKSFETNVANIVFNKYSLVIILGGYQSVTNLDMYPYLNNVILLIKKCIEIGKPLLGICLGSQLIAHTLGCEIRSSGKLNIGYDTKILGLENIFRSHIDYIVPTNAISVLEYFDNMPYLYKSGPLVYGIQCHPDIHPNSVHKHTMDSTIQKFAINNKEIINKNNKQIISHLLEKLDCT